MADGGFDPCECVWNHQMAMQRLLNLLRNSQSYCSDNECIQDTYEEQIAPGSPGHLAPSALGALATVTMYPLQCFLSLGASLSLAPVPGPQGDPSADGFGMMMMLMVGWVVIATALFLLRPQSLRRQPDAKPRPEPGDRNDGNPPVPPIH